MQVALDRDPRLGTEGYAAGDDPYHRALRDLAGQLGFHDSEGEVVVARYVEALKRDPQQLLARLPPPEETAG